MGASQKDSEGYTKLPHTFFILAPKMKEAEIRVTLTIARETIGWHRESAELSLSDFVEKTGLTRQGVSNGIADGLKRETIQRKATGQSFEYSLNFIELGNEVDQLAKATRQRSRPVNEVDQSTKLTRSRQRSRPELGNEVDQPIKEVKKLKETLKKQAPRARKKSEQKKSIPLPEDFSMTDEMQKWATALCDEYGVDVDLKIETENFKDYCRSKGSIYVDYKAGWQTRIRNCVTKLWGTAKKRGSQNGNGSAINNGNHAKETASQRDVRVRLETERLLRSTRN